MTGKMTGKEWIEWSQKQIALYNEERFNARLNQAKGKKAVFAPFLGEWGHFCMHYLRLVHFVEADYKVVCCQRGQECLFPTADEFFYDWVHPIPDEQREGTDRWIRDWPAIQAVYPDFHMVEAGGLSFIEEKIGIHLETRLPLKPKIAEDPRLKVDVCIGTRSRGLNPRQNWPHCQLIADACKARGLTFATIAHPAVGYHLDGESCMSGEFPTMDAAIQLLQDCKFYFGQDSGGAHLASTVGVNMAVLQVPHKIWAEEFARANGTPVPEFGRDFIDRMTETNAPYKTTRIHAESWFNPDEVVKAVEADLDKIKPVKPNRVKKRKPK